ncbi:unnamed protein product [Lasius platythorax]|uniref:Uncharacterized protein n=1 Tax=Lasius platythorax TaxID=488582 RepID=A0AAV2NTU1_9HYME
MPDLTLTKLIEHDPAEAMSQDRANRRALSLSKVITHIRGILTKPGHRANRSCAQAMVTAIYIAHTLRVIISAITYAPAVFGNYDALVS